MKVMRLIDDDVLLDGFGIVRVYIDVVLEVLGVFVIVIVYVGVVVKSFKNL